MKKIWLRQPTINDKKIILEYKEEFITNGDSMDGTAGLGEQESFEVWMEELTCNLHESTVLPGLVPNTTYLAMTEEDNQLIGMISIRHRLNDYLLNFGGHIGYSVRASERRNGYATEMLSLALEKCSEIGIEKVLITCDKANIGSARTIINNSGELENEVEGTDRITQRYWIDIKE